MLVAAAAIALVGCCWAAAATTVVVAGPGTVGTLPAGVAAQVGSLRITDAELGRAVEQQLAQGPSNQPIPAPGSPAHGAARQSAMARLVSERIYAIEAERCGAPCRVGARQVQARLDELKRDQRLGSGAALTAYLARLKFTVADVRALIRWQLQMERIAVRLKKPVRFSGAQALSYYRSHRARYRNPELRQARHILVAGRAEAVRVRALVTDANFATIARRYSIDPSSRNQGGDLGTLLPLSLVPPFEKALSSLALREISQPVKTQFGWHIIQVTGITPPRTLSFAEVRSSVIQTQLALRRQAAVDRWMRNVFDGWRRRTVYADRSLLPAP
jgi:foldase protein PrsA